MERGAGAAACEGDFHAWTRLSHFSSSRVSSTSSTFATWSAAAFPEDEYYCPPLEVIESERTRDQRGHFNLIHHETGFKADIYLTGRDELHAWGLSQVIRADLEGQQVMFAPPEYVIVRKLQFFREGGSPKHLRDISRMLIGLGDDWNRDTLMAMIATHRLETEWQRVLDHAD